MRFFNGKLYALAPSQVYQDGRLSRQQLRLLLAMLCNADPEGRCQLKRAQFSRELGVPENQLAEAAQELVRLGWLDRQESGGQGRTRIYRVKVPDPTTFMLGTVTDMVTVGERAIAAVTAPAAESEERAEAAADAAIEAPAAGHNGQPALAEATGLSPPDPIVITIPLLGRDGEFAVTESMVAEWQDAFPGVNVPRTLKRIRLWCLDNPARRKTRRGVRRFLTGWLARDQDRGGHADPGGGRAHDWLKGVL